MYAMPYNTLHSRKSAIQDVGTVDTTFDAIVDGKQTKNQRGYGCRADNNEWSVKVQEMQKTKEIRYTYAQENRKTKMSRYSKRRNISPSKMISPRSCKAAAALTTSAVSKSSCLSAGIAEFK